jgi:hypothetical protein
MPEYQTITTPFWKGYISIECFDGKIYKYVRNVTKRAIKGTAFPWLGDSTSTSYIWGDSALDTIGKTADTAGRIMFDFNRLSAILTNATGLGSWMFWPELGGDTLTLRRLNKEQLQPFSASSPNDVSIYLIPGGAGTGDSNSYRAYNIASYTYLRLVALSVQSISIIQERIPDWYKAQQFSVPYGNQPFGGVKI